MAPYLKSLDPNHLITIGTSSPYVVHPIRALPYAHQSTVDGRSTGPHLRCILTQHRRFRYWLAGMDGFYDRRSCQAAAGNPSSWAGYTGQDFLPQHAVAAIDFAAIHLWPDNWKRTDQSFGSVWLNTHSANGAQLQKPVVLEEFGKVSTVVLSLLQGWLLCTLC